MIDGSSPKAPDSGSPGTRLPSPGTRPEGGERQSRIAFRPGAVACRGEALTPRAVRRHSVEPKMSADGLGPGKASGADGAYRPAPEIAEHERQFREILEHCPAGLNVVDEDGRLLFHNARLRKLLGYDENEMHLFDTKRFWHDLGHRTRIIETLRERGGELLNEEAIWKT